MRTGAVILIVVSDSYAFAQRLVRIYEKDTAVTLMHAENPEQAYELANQAQADEEDHPLVIVLSRADEMANHAPLVWRMRTTPSVMSRMILVSPTLTDHDLMQLFTFGVEAYLPDTAGEQSFRLAVTCLAHDLAVLPRSLYVRFGRMAKTSRDNSREAVAPRLSAREREILQRIVAGDSNRHIGESLGISEGTVKSHVKAILRKTGSANRTQAAMIALSVGGMNEGDGG